MIYKKIYYWIIINKSKENMRLDNLGDNPGNIKDYIDLIIKSKNNIIFFG